MNTHKLRQWAANNALFLIVVALSGIVGWLLLLTSVVF